jgi:hypothetical protein
MPSIHKISDLLYIYDAQLKAGSRTTSGGDTDATTFAPGASTTTYRASEGATGMDLTLFHHDIHVRVNAGTVATSLDGKWVESDDGTTWTAVTGGAMTQMTAAGVGTFSFNVRAFHKRYAKFVVTLGGTCVFSVTILGQKRLVS